MDARHQNGCCCGSPKTLIGEGTGPAELATADRCASEPVGTWTEEHAITPAGRVPRVSTALGWSDHLGHCKVRWAIGRGSYRVEPGLYAVGMPTAEAPVLVSANYKMSFDRLRGELEGIDAWILVLETDGVNVWCAAGKGTFGTNELVQRINATGLSRVVNHDRVIVPQLAAPGVCAHEVRKRSGFRVVYGPVQAKDIPVFLEAGMQATPRMRRVDFPLSERLAVVPVELMLSAKYVFIIMLGFLILAGLGPDGYSLGRVASQGATSALLFCVTFIVGTVATPALLPWLPGRALSLKGLWIGVALTLLLGGGTLALSGLTLSWLDAAAWCLLVPMTTSVAGMNFTGATTYTSLSGVRREMKIAVPIQVAAAVAGVLLWGIGRFV